MFECMFFDVAAQILGSFLNLGDATSAKTC